MINVPEAMWDVWESGDFTGPNRPVTRASISKTTLRRAIDSSGKSMPWRTILFNSSDSTDSLPFPMYEIPNIQTCSIDRRVGTDAAQLTLTFINQLPVNVQENLDQNYLGTALSPTRRELGDLGKPGAYTFRRGQAADTYGENRWLHDINPIWVDMFIPNRLIMVYQGYGTDGAGRPENDTNLVRTGIFLVDEVTYSATGLVTITARDLAKLLIEQRLYPPIIPASKYPLELFSDHTVTDTVTDTIEEITTVNIPATTSDDLGRHVPSNKGQPVGWDSGNTPWYGYNASVYGHRPSHAFDGSNATWWLSMGNNGPNELWSFEWIESYVGGSPVNRVRFKPKWGGYVCYIGVRKKDGTWHGTDTVPYGYWTRPAAPNGSNIKYVKKINVPKNEEWVEVDLPATYEAEAVRLVFTNLVNSGLGSNPYRAAVYQVESLLHQPATSETTREEITTEEQVDRFVPGNIDDYTDIIKLFTAWSGFYWPYGTRDALLNKWREGTEGRVWGDFFYSGAYPVDPPTIDASLWDNKSVMDAINQVREVLGFVFYIDETGGVVWRPPNIWRTGNFITGVGYVGNDSVRDADEEKVLITYDATINDASLRSEIVVVSTEKGEDGELYYGSYSPGAAAGEVIESAQGDILDDKALLAGQNRVALVADFPFANQDEVDKFAFLVALWSHWAYRKSRFRIPAMPALMPDDQIRIYERVSSETYVHYLEGVTSTMDMNAGTWSMDVDTHWLGNGPDEQWLTRYKDMSPALFVYLREAGLLPDEVESDTSKYPNGWFTYDPPVVPQDPIRVDVDVDALVPEPPELIWPNYADGPEIVNTAPITGGNTTPGGGGGSTLSCSNKDKFANWGDAGPYAPLPAAGSGCRESNLGYLTFMTAGQFSGQTDTVRIRIDRRAFGAYRLLAQIMEEEGYNVFASQTGAYNCRGIRLTNGSLSSTTWSNHSWGLACDINWRLNPYRTPTTNPVLLEVIRRAQDEIWTNNGNRVFRNGNWWSNADPMHFEVCCTPEALATGVFLSVTRPGVT